MDLTTEYPLDIDVNHHARNILKKLDSMRREQKNCDLFISVEGRIIPVNRDVVCAGSDYFDAMFSHDTKEKQEGVVVMRDVEFSAVKKCIDFIYSGEISVSEDECERLLYSASLMQLNEVCEKISPLLEGRLTPKSFFNIRRIAIKFSLKSLNAVCDNFALDQLFNLVEEEGFNDLDIDYISFLLSSKKYSGRRTEDAKLSVALQWIKAGLDNREKHLMDIVNLLEIPKLTSGYALFLVESEPLCIKFPEFMTELSIVIGLSHHVQMTGPPNVPDISLTSEIMSPNSLLLFDQSSKLVHCYQPSTNKLVRVTECSSQILNTNFFSACVLEEHLYVFTKDMEAFRLNIGENNSTWIQLSDMLHDHGLDLQCTVHENFIYISGEDTMERYKIGENERWEDIDLDGNICCSSCLVGFDEYIFVIGGRKAVFNPPVNSVTKFSPSMSSWTPVKSMNVARFGASAAVFDGKIFVAGGLNTQDLHDFEMYDGVSDLWTILPEMNSPRCLFALCLVDSKIFAIEGLLRVHLKFMI